MQTPKYNDGEGVFEIANTDDPNVEADVVFVHGLGGDAYGTWEHGQEGTTDHFFWPEEMGKDLPNCAIWTVGYSAGIAILGKPGMIIESRAGNLSLKLANAGLGNRPLFFVTHSMGGLVVKSLIVESQTKPDSERKRLVKCIRGVTFCATPHRGSNLATAASILGKAFGVQAHVEEMMANSEPLDHLHDKFVEWHKQNPIAIDSYAESIGISRTRPLRRPLPLPVVVPLASANPNIAGHVVHQVSDDHWTLVKPRNRKHDVYAGVLRSIQRTLGSIPAGSRFSRVVDIEITEDLIKLVQSAQRDSPVSPPIPMKIAIEYARLAPPGPVSRAVILNANTLRAQVDPIASTIGDEDLLLTEDEIDPGDYWMRAFERARAHGDRMVVAVLSVIDKELLSMEVADLRSAFIQSICSIHR